MEKEIKDLVVGDQVIHHQRHGYDSIGTVSRLTKTQVIVTYNKTTYEYRFDRDRGYSIGGGVWDRTHITYATPEDIEKVKLKNWREYVVRKMHDVKFQDLTTEELQTIWKIVKPQIDAKEAKEKVS